MSRRFGLSDILNWLSGLTILVALVLVFLYAPMEATMGHVQRIFYFHVSSAWVGFFAFFVTLVASIAYLRTSQRSWDRLAFSSVEIGMTFTIMAVITGSIWAKPTWNAWWPWHEEPRLVLISILLLVYLAYIMLRAFLDREDKRARFSAVYGILAFISVPFTALSIRLWQRLHPVVVDQEGIHLTSPMIATFVFCLFTFTVLYVTLLMHRVRLAETSDQVAGLRRTLRAMERS